MFSSGRIKADVKTIIMGTSVSYWFKGFEEGIDKASDKVNETGL